MTLNLQPSIYSRQKGFTLLEALIAFLLLSIIVIGSGTVLSWMLKSQSEIYKNSIVINEIQKRLQKQTPASSATSASSTTTTSDACSHFDKTPTPPVAQTTYYFGCAIKTSSVPSAPSVKVSWAVVAASPNSNTEAQNCADVAAGIKSTPSISDACYIIGN